MRVSFDPILDLEQSLKGPLPGKTVQYQMSPIRRGEDHYYLQPSSARRAAVMITFIPMDGHWHLLYIKRQQHPKDKHSGQISFPGGGFELEDKTLEQCARRETFEEVGIPASEINIIGKLTELYVYASNNIVFPFVGYLKRCHELSLQYIEVEKAIVVPLSYFEEPEGIIKKTSLTVRGHQLNNVPYYDLYGEILWGATAMITHELIHLWKHKN